MLAHFGREIARAASSTSPTSQGALVPGQRASYEKVNVLEFCLVGDLATHMKFLLNEVFYLLLA